MIDSSVIAIVIFSIYGVLIIGGIIFLIYGFGYITDELIDRKLRKRFKEDLSKSLTNKVPNWNQVKIIAETIPIKRKDIPIVIKQIIKEIFSETSKLKHETIPILENYLEKHNQEEPFEGIPSEIRIHFERLKESSQISIEQLEPLTKHISDLLKINSIEKKRQKAFSIISLFVGLGGFIIGLYQFFFE